MKVTNALEIATHNEIIKHVDDNTLLWVVMLLTAGTANPAVVMHKIREGKKGSL